MHDGKIFRVALVGNPNCGKTTIFNRLTGFRQKVGNYSGVTVESVCGRCDVGGGVIVEIVDLPGCYSLSSSSPEEMVTFRELSSGDIDLVVNVIDAGNAQRNLYLTTQIAELEIPVIIVFNMIDDAEARGLSFDFGKLESFFGAAAVVATNGVSGRGMDQLLAAIRNAVTSPKPKLPLKPKYGPKIDQAMRVLGEQVERLRPAKLKALPARCIAIRLLENDPDISAIPEFAALAGEVADWRNAITVRNGIGSDALMADYRYGVVAGACREIISVNNDGRRQISQRLDQIIVNRFWGLPIFLGIMYLTFAFTFILGEYPEGWLESVFSGLAEAVNALWPAGHFEFGRRLIVDGVIGGVGGVLVFLPYIIMLFLAIAFLEGTGYMARAAFVTDGFMHIFGLHGKSFIPMVLGFGCSVPAIMATRTIESERDRLTTMLVLPFMSCGARLPIYALMIPAFFSARYRPLVMWLMYIIGAVVALVGARILKATIFRGDGEVFVMELPPYRMPTLRSLLIQMWERTVMYLKKAGTVILLASIIMFLLNSFPCDRRAENEYDAAVRELEHNPELTAAQKRERGSRLEAQLRARNLEYSIAGRIGKGLSVVLRPAGFDWKASSALIGALAGKELFVAQLGVLYSIADGDFSEGHLQEKLRENYTPLQGFCIMLFCLLSVPCIATIAVMKKETCSWRWPLFQIAMFTGTAYLLSLAVYQIGLLVWRLHNGL